MSPGRRPRPGTRPATSSTTPTSAITTPSTISIRPSSCIPGGLTAVASFKERSVPGAGRAPLRQRPLQVRVGLAGHAAAARLAGDEADLQEVGLHDLRDRFRLVVDRRRHRLQADGPAVIDVDDGLEEPAVELVEPSAVHALAAERVLRDG